MDRNSLRKAFRLVFVLLCTCFALACYVDTEIPRNNPYDAQFDTELPCQSNSDCSKVGFCASGKCAQCRTSGDCQENKACKNGKCMACEKTTDCDNGLACIEGACKECKTSGDCGGALVCRSSKCAPCESEEPGSCILSGTYSNDLLLTADTKWILRGSVFIGDDVKAVTLKIEPGTTIVGEAKTNGVLIIRRNAKIDAQGTVKKPIVFTSSQPKGSRKRGDWGGIVVNGNARLNECVADRKESCEGFGEGGTGWYGGDNDSDSSGTLRYVRIEFAGRLFSPANELNGIAFQGVGSGTTLEYIQVHMAQDDGVEFFGGNANIRYLLVTGAADDSLDWTYGWRGKGQFIIVQQYDDDGDNGIEADNNGGEDKGKQPRSRPTLANVTLIGSPKSSKSDLGMLLREGTGARIYNTIVTQFNDACFKIDQKETFDNAFKNGRLTGQLLLEHSILNCTKNFSEKQGMAFTAEDFVTKLNKGNRLIDPKLTAPINLRKPNFLPSANSPAKSGAKVLDDSFFKRTKYIGAVDPAKDWTKGWTTSAAD